MIVFTDHNEIDFKKWDHCIANAANGNHSAWSWYLNEVNSGWCALIEDEYEKVFPLPTARKFGITYSMQPLFTQQIGVFSASTSYNVNLERYINAIPRYYKYIDLNLNSKSQPPAIFSPSQMLNLELSLNKSYCEIASGYQQNLRRNLRKAETNGLSVKPDVLPETLIEIFRSNRGNEIKTLDKTQYEILSRLIQAHQSRGKCECQGIYTESGELLGGIVWIFSHNKAVFLFSALTTKGKQLNAMSFAIDYFIRQHADSEMIIDFEGSNNEGIARFYRSFGSNEIFYWNITLDRLPALGTKALEAWQKVRQPFK